MSLCLGEFSVADFQLAFASIDDECKNAFSKSPKVIRVKKRWALDDLQLHADYANISVWFRCRACVHIHTHAIRRHMCFSG